MRVYIDLGAYKGYTLKAALRAYKDFDKYYAFEPFKATYKILQNRFSNNPKVVLKNVAADFISQKNVKLYLHKKINRRSRYSTANSLLVEKNNINKDSYELIETIDFSEWLMNNFKKEDEIVLKINIEGGEYRLLDKMIKDGSIKYITRLFCGWHFNKLKNFSEEIHYDLVRKLQKLGFNLTGRDEDDEFINAIKKNEANIEDDL